MPTAATERLTIQKGRYWSRTFQLQDSSGSAIDLTGYTAAAQIRATADPASRR